jgi:CRISPR system Cascade subunit CasB
MNEHQPDARIVKFLTKLQALDPGDRAKFKRDAGSSIAEAQSIGLFYRLLPYGVSQRDEEAYFLVATLYPLADGGGRGNFGDALRKARDLKNNKGLDRRFEILLDTESRVLPFRLRQAVRFLKSKRVRVNWGQLIEDVCWWEHSSRGVQKRWARSYFGLSSIREKDNAASERNT